MALSDSENKKPLGGKRPGAGRKSGTGVYGEPTTVIRIPTSQKSVVSNWMQAYVRKKQNTVRQIQLDPVSDFAYPDPSHRPVLRPLFNAKVPAGLPSPADDHVEKRLDPTEFLIDKADSTFFVTIQGESMIEAGLMPGDKAVVDRAKLPVVGDIVLAIIDGEFTIKTLGRHKNGRPRLLPANSSGQYTSIEITDAMQFEIWGVVTGSFRRFR